MSQRTPIIGLAGGIGAGKSHVARLMAGQGGAVFDADDVARRMLDAPDVRSAVIGRWGESMLEESGRVDRRRVAEKVFGDADERRFLEGLIHPQVEAARRRFVEAARADPDARFVVLDVPLLFEVGLDRECDRIVFVEADRRTRLARIADRGWDAADLARREKNQWPLDKKRALAHDIIRNSNGEVDCLEQVRALLSRFLG